MEEEELLANIEALLRLQGRAQSAIRERDEFLSVAAHELKTPLTALRLHLERTLYLTTRGASDTLPKPTVEKSLTPALRQIDRLQQLLDTLLDVSRVTSHKLRLDISALDLVELTRRSGPAARGARPAPWAWSSSSSCPTSPSSSSETSCAWSRC